MQPVVVITILPPDGFAENAINVVKVHYLLDHSNDKFVHK